MIVIQVFAMCLTLLFMFAPSVSCGAETVVVTKAFNGREIKVKAGSMIQVELEQAGATGYVWEIKDLDEEHFEIASVTTPKPPQKPDLVGAPVKKTWLIRAKARGKSEIKCIHYRPWEGEEKAADTFVLKVRIL